MPARMVQHMRMRPVLRLLQMLCLNTRGWLSRTIRGLIPSMH